MLPEKCDKFMGLLLPMAQVSDMPQPSIMVEPVSSFHALAVLSEAAMPPACVT